jgi:plastocyanin
MKKTAVMLVLAAMAMTLVACGGDDDSNDASDGGGAAPSTVAVRAGVNDPKDRNVAVLAFLPQSVTVKTGATVKWTASGPEPHTITFLPLGQTPPTPDKPENAALRAKTVAGAYDGTQTLGTTIIPTGPKPETFEVSFPKAGEFSYNCIIHPGMAGTVKVVDDEASAESQDDIDARAATEQNKWLVKGRAAKKTLTDTPAKKTANADGSTTWTIEMGANVEHIAVLAFQPVNAAIKAGDTVTFINNSGDPHTASFKGTKTLPANPESAEAMAPAPGPSPQTLNATDLFSTGWLPPNAPPGQGPPEAVRSYSYKVPAAGDYTYVCLLHSPSGMGGTIKAT